MLDPRDVSRDRDANARDRAYDGRERSDDPRAGLLHDLDLPLGREREVVLDRDRVYELNGDESRRLAESRDESPEWDDTLAHLQEHGLVHTVSLGDHEQGLTLTDRGLDLLEANRRAGSDEDGQAFHAGVDKARELHHDSHLFAAYRLTEARLRDQHDGGAGVRRVVLEEDLKREYQSFLQDHNRDRSESDGRPDRDQDEIRGWARQHDLPYFDDQVHFPDFRVEYEVDGRERREDVELLTPHYRGAHGRAVRPADSPASGSAARVAGGAVLGIPAWPRSYWHEPGVHPVLRLRQRAPGPRCGPPSVRPDRAPGPLPDARARVLRRLPGAAVLPVAGIVHGQKSHDFVARLIDRGFVTPITPGSVRRGRLYHVQFKPLYEAIGEPNNRHRKPATLGRLIARLMVLDAVLADDRYYWLGTERGKVHYFDTALSSPPRKETYPRSTYGAGPDAVRRLFLHKLPIGVEKDGFRRHVFLYLVTDALPWQFRQFLLDHAQTLMACPLLAFAERILPRAAAQPCLSRAGDDQTCGCRRRWTTSSGCRRCFFRKGSRTTDIDSIEPP